MSYHSAQIHLAVTRLISAYGFETSPSDVVCTTVDLDGNVAYQISGRGKARFPVARVLRDTLGEERPEHEPGDALVTLDGARRLMETAYS